MHFVGAIFTPKNIGFFITLVALYLAFFAFSGHLLAAHTSNECAILTASAEDYQNCLDDIPQTINEQIEYCTETLGVSSGSDFEGCMSGFATLSQPVNSVSDCVDPTSAAFTELNHLDDDPIDVSDNPIYLYLLKIVNTLSIGVVIVSTISLAVRGLQYASARDNTSATKRALASILSTSGGIALYAFGWVFLNWIVPGGLLNQDVSINNEPNTIAAIDPEQINYCVQPTTRFAEVDYSIYFGSVIENAFSNSGSAINGGDVSFPTDYTSPREFALHGDTLANRKNVIDYLKGLMNSPNMLSGQQGIYGRNQYIADSLAGEKPFTAINGGDAWSVIKDGVTYNGKLFGGTGRSPAILGADYANWGGPGTATYIDIKIANEAITRHWKNGGISSLNIEYWPSPLYGANTTDGTPTFRSDSDVDLILPGGSRRSVWEQDLNIMSDGLLELQEKGIPVIWRPFGEPFGKSWPLPNSNNADLHEAADRAVNPVRPTDGGAAYPFWWRVGLSGDYKVTAAKWQQLWRDMHDYFNQKGVQNVIWSYGPSWWNGDSYNAYWPVGTEVLGFSLYQLNQTANDDYPLLAAYRNMVNGGQVKSDTPAIVAGWGNGEAEQSVPFDMMTVKQWRDNKAPWIVGVINWLSNGLVPENAPGDTPRLTSSPAQFGLQNQNSNAYMNSPNIVTIEGMNTIPEWVFNGATR